MLCLLQVCDEPHPLLVKEMIKHCVDANIDEAYKVSLLLLPPSPCVSSAGGGAHGGSGTLCHFP